MVSLKIQGLRKSFPRILALDNVDLEVKEGEYVVILGPTGAGKTTLLRTIAGLIKQDSGHIYFDGEPVDHLAPFERAVAYLPQNYSLFGHMTVRQNVAFGPTVQDWDPRRREKVVSEMLDLVHLTRRQDAYPHELSGGMQQRVALARALATQARILLLDEPLRALDARLRLELRGELRNLAKYLGITTLHVTHDQEEAISIADRIAVLRGGRVVEIGPPREVYEGREDPFVANFVGEANFFQGRLERVTDRTSVVALASGFKALGRRVEIPLNSQVILGVKADRCELLPGRQEGDNCFNGTVTRKLFLGKRTSFEIRTSVGLLKARTPSNRARLFSEGAEATLRFRSDDGTAYPLPHENLERVLEVE